MKRAIVSLTTLALLLTVRFAFATGAADSASGASTSQKLAGLMSLATSAVMTQQCTSTKNPSTCTMAALSASQALSLASNSAASTTAANAASTTTTAATATPDTTDYGSLTGTSATQNEAAARAVLTDEGYSLSADGSTLTTPSGSSVSAASMSGDSGMSSAGLSAAQIKEAKAALADARTAALARAKNAMAADEGGGGGGGSGASGRSRDGGTVNYSFGGPKRKVVPNLSGMTKNFGGEKIGVSGDDIFEMMTRRYKQEDASLMFIRN